MLEQTNFAFAVQEFEGKVVSVYAQSGKCAMINNTKGIVVHGHRDSIFKENTIQQCTCTVSIILAISIKALARALSFSETLHAAFRFSF